MNPRHFLGLVVMMSCSPRPSDVHVDTIGSSGETFETSAASGSTGASSPGNTTPVTSTEAVTPTSSSGSATAGSESSSSGASEESTAQTGDPTGLAVGCGNGIPEPDTYCFVPRPPGIKGTLKASQDFDGDGHLDLAVWWSVPNSVSFFRGDGVGDLDPTGDMGLPPGSFLTDAAMQAINYDGDADIDVVLTTPESILVFENDGLGAFSSPVSHALPEPLWPSALLDTDDDGRPDLVADGWIETELQIYRNTPNGFVKTPFSHPIKPCYISAISPAMLNDGAADIVFTTSCNNPPAMSPLTTMLGTGIATLMPNSELMTGRDPVHIFTHDMNGDSSDDVVVTNRQSSDVRIYLGTGEGGLVETALIPKGCPNCIEPYAAWAGDLDGDTLEDDLGVVAQTNQGYALVVLLSATDDKPKAMQVGPSLLSLVFADLNEDGVDDIIYSDPDTTVNLLLSNP